MQRDCFEVDGARFATLEGFAAEFTERFCQRFGARWNGNLDAFNDYLTWPEEPYVLIWKHSELSRQNLGHEAMAEWLRERVANCHWTNTDSMRARLTLAERGEGQTLFELLVEIIHSHPDLVEFRLE